MRVITPNKRERIKEQNQRGYITFHLFTFNSTSSGPKDHH